MLLLLYYNYYSILSTSISRLRSLKASLGLGASLIQRLRRASIRSAGRKCRCQWRFVLAAPAPPPLPLVFTPLSHSFLRSFYFLTDHHKPSPNGIPALKFQLSPSGDAGLLTHSAALSLPEHNIEPSSAAPDILHQSVTPLPVVLGGRSAARSLHRPGFSVSAFNTPVQVRERETERVNERDKESE